ncbi:hypothetical protein QWM81_13005 [Streptomyces ficellus]|uniref:DUF2007 domain-containing protein n=1 Tax=Streptomyces ficellus TaxID=1977088 RepID=A0ABT7Z625_9ACTN|nr:hypothetical protein [Streptomyces ficellus]MDN3294954.1 hypothetical protein [Streptomyces ficellus]
MVLVGGYVDLEASVRRHGLVPAQVAGVPVTEIRGGLATVHIAADEDAAVRLAQKLHDDLPIPATTPTVPPTVRDSAGVRS